MNLLVDIGNSRLKWAVSTPDGLSAGQALANSGLTLQRLTDAWRVLPQPERVALSCVSARALFDLACAAAGELWPGIRIFEARSSARALGIENAYPEPEKLGVDRWLALLAAHDGEAKAPLCVVDCGTAITVDLLDSNGRHLGGMISPGLELMRRSLSAGTAALRYDNAEFAGTSPANQTAAAIRSGVLAAAAGLIEHVFSTQPENCRLVLTGGDADLIAGQLAYASRIDFDLVLRGLSLLLEENA